MKNKSLLTKVLAFFVCFGLLQNLAAQTNLTWQDRGPLNNAGPMRAVIFDQSDATGKTIIAGSLNGGLWKTVNQGLYWEKINVAGSNLAVSCLYQASDNKIYAGTGTYYDNQKAALRVKGSGLYVSSDANNFTLVEGTNGAGWDYINAVAIDNQGRMYVATATGLMYRDAGSSVWSVAKGTNEGVALDLTGVVYDVKTSTNGLVIAFVDGKAFTSSNAGPEQFVCQSLKYKDGANWVNPGKLPKNDISRMNFAIAPSDQNVVYASSAASVGSLEGVYASFDGGIVWRTILPFTTGTWNIFAGSGVNYGTYNNEIIVAPDNSEKVFVGCVNMYSGHKAQDTGFYEWNGGPISFSDSDPSDEYYIHSFHNDYAFHPAHPELMVIASDGGITLSKSQAASFSTINKFLGCAHVRSIAVNNYDDILVGTFGSGVQFLDGSSGNFYDGFEKFDGNLTGNGGALMMSQIGKKLFYMNKSASVGNADFNNFTRSDDGGVSYSASFKDGAMTNGKELMPMALYENYHDATSVDSVKFVAMKPFSEGEVLLARSKTDRFPFQFTCPKNLDLNESLMLIDPVETRFFIGWNDKLYMSMNMTVFSEIPEWWKIADIEDDISKIAFSKTSDYVYFGTKAGKVYRLSNVVNAKTIEKASVDSAQCVIVSQLIAEFPNTSITSIAVDESDDNHVIVTLANNDETVATSGIYHTTNATAATPVFVSIHGNLPLAKINASMIEMNGNYALVGTSVGLFYSNNMAAATWTKEEAMGTIPVTQIYQQTKQHAGLFAAESYNLTTGEAATGTYYPPTSNYGVIYVGTYGRGVWSSSDFVGIVDNPATYQNGVKSLAINPNPVTDNMILSLENKFNGQAQVVVYDLKGQKVKELMVEMVNGQSASIDCSDLVRGTYMVQLGSGSFSVTQKFVVVK